MERLVDQLHGRKPMPVSLAETRSLVQAIKRAWAISVAALLVVGMVIAYATGALLGLVATDSYVDPRANQWYRSHAGDNWYMHHPNYMSLVINDPNGDHLLFVGDVTMGGTPYPPHLAVAVPVRAVKGGFGASRPDREKYGEHGYMEIEAGLPFRSMRSTLVLGRSIGDSLDPSFTKVIGGARVELTEWIFGQRMYRMIPLRPVWPGFVLNTAFYAALAGTPFLIIRLRRLRRCAKRERRGECIWCRYDTKGLNRCPECGGPCIPWRHAVMAGAITGYRSDRFLRRVNRAPAVGSSDRPTTKA